MSDLEFNIYKPISNGGKQVRKLSFALAKFIWFQAYFWHLQHNSVCWELIVLLFYFCESEDHGAFITLVWSRYMYIEGWKNTRKSHMCIFSPQKYVNVPQYSNAHVYLCLLLLGQYLVPLYGKNEKLTHGRLKLYGDLAWIFFTFTRHKINFTKQHTDEVVHGQKIQLVKPRHSCMAE